MRRRPREISVFSVSFLDVLACGLGAVVVLLMLSSFEANAAAERAQHAMRKLELTQREYQENLRDMRRVEDRLRQAERRISVLRSESQRRRALEAQVAEAEAELESLRNRTFFGFNTTKKRILILVDRSGSMTAHRDVLRFAVRMIVDFMVDETFAFNMLLFPASAEQGARDFETWGPARTLLPATTSNKDAAKEWVGPMWVAGSTPTLTALQEAFRFPELQALFLLTDGEPTDIPAADLPAAVKGLNVGRGVEIHTIGIGPSLTSALERLLRQIANENGGEYHSVW